MKGYSRGMFDEMDEIFDHLFARMQEDFMNGNPQVSGFRFMMESPQLARSQQDLPLVKPRASASPPAEVHQLDDEVKIIAELPGASMEQIRLNVRDSILIIDADGIDTPYHTTADLPPVDEDSLQSTFRNGVLEVTFQTRK